MPRIAISDSWNIRCVELCTNALQICKRKPETFPFSALELVEAWVAAQPSESQDLLRSPLRRWALEKMRKSMLGNIPNAQPVLLGYLS